MCPSRPPSGYCQRATKVYRYIFHTIICLLKPTDPRKLGYKLVAKCLSCFACEPSGECSFVMSDIALCLFVQFNTPSTHPRLIPTLCLFFSQQKWNLVQPCLVSRLMWPPLPLSQTIPKGNKKYMKGSVFHKQETRLLTCSRSQPYLVPPSPHQPPMA